MIDLRYPLAVLANRMLWQEIEASLAQRLARQVKADKKIETWIYLARSRPLPVAASPMPAGLVCQPD
jgi:IS5 family transposase